MKIAAIDYCRICHKETYHENVASLDKPEVMRCTSCMGVDGVRLKSSIGGEIDVRQN